MSVTVYTVAYEVIEVHDGRAVAVYVERPETETLDIVTPGPIGPQGPVGPPGPPGPYAPIFEQHFANPEIEWVIHHNMNLFPVVTLWDEDGDEITGDISMPDRNTVIVDFEVPFSGTARLKG